MREDETLPELFDAWLSQLESGASIDEIVAAARGAEPEISEELRPLLETAAAASALQPDPPPYAAQLRSRTRMLVQAERLRRGRLERARSARRDR